MAILAELKYQARYAIPLWLAQLLTNWLPDNRVTIRLRGMLVAMVLPQCGKGLSLGRDVTLLGVDRLVVGNHVYLAKSTWINAIGGLDLEDEVVTAPYAVIASSNHGFKDGSVRFGGGHPAPVRIGRGTWLGAHAVITAGVTVGKGNIVGANAVVTKDTPDDVFVGGVPAKVIGPHGADIEGVHRREEHTISKPDQ